MCQTTTWVADWTTRPMYSRGPCTDSAWESDQCPHFCFGTYLLSSYADHPCPSCYLGSYFLRLHASINESEGDRSSDVGMFQCPDKKTYCCDNEACACKNGTGTIAFQDSAYAFTVIDLFQSPTTSESQTSSSSIMPSSTNLLATSPILDLASSRKKLGQSIHGIWGTSIQTSRVKRLELEKPPAKGALNNTRKPRNRLNLLFFLKICLHFLGATVSTR